MFLMPPQHGKSTISSRSFPAWSLGRNPLHDVISASATQELADDFGRDVRNVIASPECRRLFPGLALAEDSQAKGKWNTKEGGLYYATGIGGTLFGRGATRAIIDDPFASWEDAQNERARNRVWDWYTGTLYNRVRPGGAIVLIQHRLHEDDLAGRLIAQMADSAKDQWRIVNLPAIDEYGCALWPERYDVPALERIRINTAPLKWSALYQQEPLPEEGTFFKRENLELVPLSAVPKNAHRYMSGDFAVKEPEEGQSEPDYTDIATHAYAGDTLYLGLEGWYGQKSPDKWIEALIEQGKRHKPFVFFGEGGVIRRAVEPFLTRRMLEERTVIPCEWINRHADKPTMARSLQGMSALGRVKIVDTEYGRRLLAQLLKFPGGRFDDAVDMAVNMALAIDQAHPSILPPPPKEPEAPRGARTIQEMVDRFERRADERQRIR